MPTEMIQGKAEANLSVDETEKKSTSERLLRSAETSNSELAAIRHSSFRTVGETVRDVLPKVFIDDNSKTKDSSPEAIEKKKADIEQKYQVEFETKETCPPADRDKFREPTVEELEILEWALAKSQGSVKPNVFGINKLNIMFSNETKGASAYHSSRSGMLEDSRVVITSTEKVLSKEDTTHGQSLGSVLLHEFGHRSSFMAEHDIEELGWKKIGPQNSDVAIETKDGRLYQFVEEKGVNGNRTNVFWLLVDKNGNSLSSQPDGRLTDEQMREREKVSQPMRPANNPSETFANAMRMFCQNEATRTELKSKCPDMYRYIEEYDRKQLRRLGTDFFGINEYVRDKNGDIVRNSEAWNPLLM